jgi:6-pyruvoyltetrahydropterin/6-carboxytetrahydropterin synthase
MLITQRLEFDAGHRIPNHKSQCQHLHGHRYVIEITLSGNIISTEGISEQGMVMDFSDVKLLAKKHLVDNWDHAFIVWKKDTTVLNFLNSLPHHKTVVLNAPPTAENLVLEAFNILTTVFKTSYGENLALERVRLYETPNSWAEAIKT